MLHNRPVGAIFETIGILLPRANATKICLVTGNDCFRLVWAEDHADPFGAARPRVSRSPLIDAPPAIGDRKLPRQKAMGGEQFDQIKAEPVGALRGGKRSCVPRS